MKLEWITELRRNGEGQPLDPSFSLRSGGGLNALPRYGTRKTMHSVKSPGIHPE